MIKSQKKCPKCAKWTDGTQTHCSFCDATIDPILLAKEQRRLRDAEALRRRLAEENKFERFLRKLEESEKPFHKFSFSILSVIFNIYMAILSFFIWLIALASG
jgi:hypothetical protein